MWTYSGNNAAKDPIPFMNTITSCINKAAKEGYRESFTVTKRGLYAVSNSRYYRPEQIQIVNFYRFEGQSDPGNNTTMYVIETFDGLKGTIVDAYSYYSDASVSKFMSEVEEITKKIACHNQHDC